MFRQAPLTQKEMLALDGIKDRLPIDGPAAGGPAPSRLERLPAESILRQLAIGVEQKAVRGGFSFTASGQRLQEVHRLRATAAFMDDRRIMPALKKALSKSVMTMDEIAANFVAQSRATGQAT